MSIKKTDVLGNLVYASVSMACANEIPGYNGTLFAISEETKERIEADIGAARVAVAELIEAANYAYPPGDYSQDAHGYAVRSALDNIGGAK